MRESCTTGLWLDEAVPKSGWVWRGIRSLNFHMEHECEECAMCWYRGKHPKNCIRTLHKMEHPNHRDLYVGRYCAGHMMGNVERALYLERLYHISKDV